MVLGMFCKMRIFCEKFLSGKERLFLCQKYRDILYLQGWNFGIILAKMKPWDKQEIEIAGGAKVMAQVPLIVSASRSTDVPAFYSDWFIGRLEAGNVKWFNPFNGVPLYGLLQSRHRNIRCNGL